MTKTDKRTRSDAQRRKTKIERLARADVARRQREWCISAKAASNAGYPINAFITIMAGKDIARITNTVWRKLRQMTQDHGTLFLAARGPEYTPQKKDHLHLAMHLRTFQYTDTVRILTEAISEEMGSWGIDIEGRKVGGQSGVVAISKNGTWMLQRHLQYLNGSSEKIASYTAKASGKARAIGRHQRSQDLVALTKDYTSKECVGAIRLPYRAIPVASYG